MTFDPTEVTVVTRVLPLIQIGVQEAMSRAAISGGRGWEVGSYIDAISGALIYQATNWFVSQPLIDVIDIRYPADWWEAVKDRFAPSWFRRRWPVRYICHYVDVRHVYPEFKVPPSFGREVRFAEHRQWTI